MKAIIKTVQTLNKIRNRLLVGTLLIGSVISARGQGQGQVSTFSDLPKGYSAQEVGQKLSRRFLVSEHMLHGEKWIHYAEVCTWLGALRFADAIDDEVLIDELEQRFSPLFTAQKDLLPIKNHVDLNMFGALPLTFYGINANPAYLHLGLPYADTQWELPADATEEQRKLASAGYSWQTRLWIDDMFMITIIQAEAYKVSQKRDYIERAAKSMVYYLEQLQRPNGLFYHAPDVPFYWGRGNGWMAAGMTELLKVLPKDSAHYQRIMDSYLLMMASLRKYQNKEGMWNQLIDDPLCWAETSGSAMFAYAFITGVKEGWLEKEAYQEPAKKAWIALVNYINEEGDVTEVCVGTNKKNDRQHYYDRPRVAGDFHGQAPVLWCAYALSY
ncbi:glycoside hydrolase family 88/105 protein [Olivibacter sitiensis]|uniref:glycoside hydrolase family 88/105 protein n=1 Tax=Olivibacter sitiensis TaxID=376470 RepID=UPI0009FD91F7|nr:glycoside hydrolase family 88 protein [Olivibacter sitiensis]